MCIEIDARTRENPEAAMMHSASSQFNQALTPQQAAFQSAASSWASQQAQSDPWPWPAGADPVLQVEREKMASGGGPTPAPHADSIDRQAYDEFMRSLG
jgi:hypothetical protein